MTAKIIYEDSEIQIVAYDGEDGNVFGLYENGIYKINGGQREIIHMTIDKEFWGDVKNIIDFLLASANSFRDSIKRRQKSGQLLSMPKK